MKIQFENGNKRPYENWKKKTTKIMKIEESQKKKSNQKMEIQFENGNNSPFRNWKESP